MKTLKLADIDTLITKVGKHNDVDTAPGFSFESTPSHGYVRTTEAITQAMPAYMRSTSFSSPGRYEEDCDWCLPVVCNLSLFGKNIQSAALKTFYHWHPEKFRKFFNLDPVDSYKLKAA